MTLFILPLFLGPTELILILLVVLLLFGGRKIPELMRGLGRGVKEFKDSSKEDGKDGGSRARRRGKRTARHERKTTASGAPPRRADRQAAGIRHPAPREQAGKRDRTRATKAMYATRRTYRTA